jgi:hypothetical protein
MSQEKIKFRDVLPMTDNMYSLMSQQKYHPLMNRFRAIVHRTRIFIAIIGLAASGCQDNGGLTFSASFSEYVQRIESDAGVNVTFCGEVTHLEHDLEANTCLVDAFMEKRGAYILAERSYNNQRVTDAWLAHMTDESAKVFYYWLELPVSGRESGAKGTVDIGECKDPSFSGTLDTSSNGLFNCGPTYPHPDNV